MSLVGVLAASLIFRLGIIEPKHFDEDCWSPRVFLGILPPQRLAQIALGAFIKTA
jgi:hypothetical protein